MIDGMMSAVAGVILVSVQFLEGTFLAGVIPIADSILVILLCLAAFGTPASLLRRSLDEITGKSCSEERLEEVKEAIRDVLSESQHDGFELIDFQMTKMGRSHYCIAHVLPNKSVNVDELDAARASVVRACKMAAGSAMAEVVFTSKTAFAELD